MDFVVPISLKWIAVDVDLLKFLIAHLALFGVVAIVEPSMNLQTFRRSDRSDVSGNQQSPGAAVSLPSHPFPPWFDRSNRKRGHVAIDSHRNSRLVSLQIINAVGNGLADSLP